MPAIPGGAGADAEGEGGKDGLRSVREERATANDIKTTAFEELVLEPHVVKAAQAAWSAFCNSVGSPEAVGEAVYASLFESAPTLQGLFVTPRAVQALRFVTGIHNAVATLEDPCQLKLMVEALGFLHMNIEVTIPRVVIFRDAILDLIEVELEDGFVSDARDGWMALLNYIGGSIIYIRAHYADRLRMLRESWQIANKKSESQRSVTNDAQDGNTVGEQHHLQQQQLKQQEQQHQHQQGQSIGNHGRGGLLRLWPFSREVEDKDKLAPGGLGQDASKAAFQQPQEVPKNFTDMFQFNATVMGLGKHQWMKEVLASFNDMVENVANSTRLREECDVLALRISKCGAQSTVNLSEYKSCMLASLRQLLMKEWNTSYETAWNWFWDCVEGSLQRNLASPPAWERSLGAFLGGLGDSAKTAIVTQLYERFFEAAPQGQDYFKQSTSRLHFIALQLLQISLGILQDPWKQVDEISALGLRHVAYGVPTELFSPFVSAGVQALAACGAEPHALDAFRWSAALVSRIIVRTVNEGSTVVMRAINVNSARQLQRAVSGAPRGERARSLLVVQVGTHSISPLSWAIESGSLEAAEAILRDLLAIRADRERYYYGAEELFRRHPDLVRRLVADAPSLLPALLDGLVWRSREAKRGRRRANYFVKHLMVDQAGDFSDALRHLVASNDPQIISHPAVILVSDTLWNGIVRSLFISSRAWLVSSLVIMMLSQAILPKLEAFGENQHVRIPVFVGRALIYTFTMARFLFLHARDIAAAYCRRQTMRLACVPVPTYLLDPYQAASLLLASLLFLMILHEPMLYCMGSGDPWPSSSCPEASRVDFRYSVFCMCAMGTHWLMLMDLAVFNTGLTAFLLVIMNVMSEIGLFLVALSFLLLTFASAISVLEHTYDDMSDVFQTFIALFAITVNIYEDDYRDFQEDPVLLTAVFCFVTASAILLLNLLIAQLNCSYVYIYQNMVGFARLKRARVIVETLAACARPRWRRFVAALGLDRPLEFNEGDVGPAGGLSVLEAAGAHAVTQDRIQRFGGSCAPEMSWPEESAAREDRLERMERLLQKTMKRISRRRGGGRGGASSGSGGSPGRSGSSSEGTASSASED